MTKARTKQPTTTRRAKSKLKPRPELERLTRLLAAESAYLVAAGWTPSDKSLYPTLRWSHPDLSPAVRMKAAVTIQRSLDFDRLGLADEG